MILHIIKDEKITDQVIDNFRHTDDKHFFLIICSDDREYIFRKGERQNISCFNYLEHDINIYIQKYLVKAIIVHGMFLQMAKTILNIKENVKIGWIEWGADIYSLPRIKPEIYGKKTNDFLLQADKKLSILRYIKKRPFIRTIYYRIFLRRDDPYRQLSLAIKKTDFFISYIREDFDVFSNYYINNLEYLYCTFSNLHQYLSGNGDVLKNENASNILIGNSNSAENNHLDLFANLKGVKRDFSKTDFYVPLSYGKDVGYKKEVITKGNFYLGSNFKPLLEFMDRRSYIKLLQSCSTAIFYHYRQQAMGNIIALLYMGVRVYLSERNPVFAYLKRIGIVVFSFDKEFAEFYNTQLDDNVVNHNREIISSIFSKEKVNNDIRNLCELLRSS